MRDDETESYRREQGKPPLPDPREPLGDVPIVFSSEGGGAGVLLPAADERLGPPPGEIAESAGATDAVERGAAAIEAERSAGRAGHGRGGAQPPDGGAGGDAASSRS